MGNFNPSLSENANIFYVANGKCFLGRNYLRNFDVYSVVIGLLIASGVDDWVMCR